MDEDLKPKEALRLKDLVIRGKAIDALFAQKAKGPLRRKIRAVIKPFIEELREFDVLKGDLVKEAKEKAGKDKVVLEGLIGVINDDMPKTLAQPIAFSVNGSIPIEEVDELDLSPMEEDELIFLGILKE
jgi:hypothetical protein